MPLRLPFTKRPFYFNGQLLDEEDFRSEQTYLLTGGRSHGQNLHLPGIVNGLDVSAADASTVVLLPGVAIDSLGREIRVDQIQKLPVRTNAATALLTLGYEEQFSTEDKSSDVPEQSTRTTETAVLDIVEEAGQPNQSEKIVLARILLQNGRITEVSTAVRRYAGARLAPLSVEASHLSDASVSGTKLAPSLRAGWVRLPFKPSPFTEPQGGSTGVFSIGVTNTYCGPEGAKGTASIPVPALANMVKQFAIAGERNEAGLKIAVHRCGWNAKQNTHESTILLQQTIPKDNPFHLMLPINQPLDPASHALALYVEALNVAKISLIAAEFQLTGSSV